MTDVGVFILGGYHCTAVNCKYNEEMMNGKPFIRMRSFEDAGDAGVRGPGDKSPFSAIDRPYLSGALGFVGG